MNPLVSSPVSTPSASTVASRKSRNGKEAIETVCNRACALLVVQVQMMPASKGRDPKWQLRQQVAPLRQHAAFSDDKLRRTTDIGDESQCLGLGQTQRRVQGQTAVA